MVCSFSRVQYFAEEREEFVPAMFGHVPRAADNNPVRGFSYKTAAVSTWLTALLLTYGSRLGEKKPPYRPGRPRRHARGTDNRRPPHPLVLPTRITTAAEQRSRPRRSSVVRAEKSIFSARHKPYRRFTDMHLHAPSPRYVYIRPGHVIIMCAIEICKTRTGNGRTENRVEKPIGRFARCRHSCWRGFLPF